MDCYEFYINDYWIAPFNGPFPGLGALPNMNGEGNGYLYYRGESVSSNDYYSVSNSKNNSQKHIKNEKRSQDRILEKLNLIK